MKYLILFLPFLLFADCQIYNVDGDYNASCASLQLGLYSRDYNFLMALEAILFMFLFGLGTTLIITKIKGFGR